MPPEEDYKSNIHVIWPTCNAVYAFFDLVMVISIQLFPYSPTTVMRLGRTADHSPPSNAVVMEE